MGSDRRKILEMLHEGSISTDDAECLIDALGPGYSGPSESGTQSPAPTPRKYLRVVVEAIEEGHSKATNVNVRVPLQLLRAGVRLTSFLPQEARWEVERALSESGINLDLDRLKPEHIDELIEALSETVVDIDAPEASARVKVYCE